MTSFSAATGDRINFVMLNIDNPKWSPEVRDYGVEAVPKFEYLNGKGELKATINGRAPREALVQYANDLLTNSATEAAADSRIVDNEADVLTASTAKRMSSSSPRAHG